MHLNYRPAINDDYGAAGSWCWIKKSNRSLFWRMFEFYIPLWIAIIYNSYAYYKVIKWLKLTMQDNMDNRIIKRFMAYPMILFFCWFFASYNRIHTLFYKESMVLNVLHRLFGSLQGLLNAIIYGMNQNVRREVKRFMRNHWLFKNCVKKNNNQEALIDESISPFERRYSSSQDLKIVRMSTGEVELKMKQLNSG